MLSCSKYRELVMDTENKEPKICGLLANQPTKLSLVMHTAGYEALGLNYIYKTFDTINTKEALEDMQAKGIRGLSLTIPHKENAVALVDEISKSAKAIGAINTVVNDGEKLAGDNTDCYGITEAFKEAGCDIKGKQVLIIGAGGAARAACYVFSESRITIANRNLARAEKLAADFSTEAIELASIDASLLAKVDILINSTPIGSHLASEDSEQLAALVKDLPKSAVIFDMVTKETDLISAGKSKGLKTIEGPRMLLYQALEQFRLFTGVEAPKDDMETALYLEL